MARSWRDAFELGDEETPAAPADQLASHLAIIVEFAVERYGNPAVRAQHRLVGPSARIDHREPPVSERQRARGVYPHPVPVGTAVLQHVGHPLHLAADLGQRPVRRQPGNAAHQPVPA